MIHTVGKSPKLYLTRDTPIHTKEMKPRSDMPDWTVHWGRSCLPYYEQAYCNWRTAQSSLVPWDGDNLILHFDASNTCRIWLVMSTSLGLTLCFAKRWLQKPVIRRYYLCFQRLDHLNILQ